jgi:hypothetical protein
MNTDALMLTSGFLRSFCLLETAKIDVFTDLSQVKPVDGDARPLVFWGPFRRGKYSRGRG